MSTEKQEQDTTAAESTKSRPPIRINQSFVNTTKSKQLIGENRNKEFSTEGDEEFSLGMEFRRMKSLTTISSRNTPTSTVESKLKELLTNSCDKKDSIPTPIGYKHKRKSKPVRYGIEEQSPVHSKKNKQNLFDFEKGNTSTLDSLANKLSAIENSTNKLSIVETIRNSFLTVDMNKIKSSTLGNGKDEFLALHTNKNAYSVDDSEMEVYATVAPRKNSPTNVTYSKGGSIMTELNNNEVLTTDFAELNEHPSTSFNTPTEFNDRSKHNERVQDILKSSMSFSSASEFLTESELEPDASTFQERCDEISMIFQQVSEIYMNKNETAEEHNKLRDLHNMLAERYISMALATEDEDIDLNESPLQEETEDNTQL